MFYIIWLEVALFSNYFGYEISWDNIKSRIPNIDARSRDLLTTNMRHFRVRSFFNFFVRVSVTDSDSDSSHERFTQN